MPATKFSSRREAKVERWLGPDLCAQVRSAVAGGPGPKWYGPPILIGNVPGEALVTKDGDFVGPVKAGRYSSLMDYFLVEAWRRAKKFARSRAVTAGALSFSSFSDMLTKASQAGRKRVYPFSKVGPTGVTGAASTLWRVGNLPAGGSAPSAAPGGTARDDTATGTFPFVNPASGDAQFFCVGNPAASVVGNTIMLYDRLFDVLKTMASTGTEAVTGVPTRYQSGTSTDADYIGGNFVFVETGGTALAGTAHNWTVCTYKDQGDAASTFPSMAGISGCIVDRLDMPLMHWFMPLETGDVGVKALTQMQCSASVATGVINFVVGHPIAIMPCPIQNMTCILDAYNTPGIIERIFDDACLAFLELPKPSATATTYSGNFITVQS